MWKVTLVVDCAARPKLSDIPALMDDVTSITVEKASATADAVQAEKYRTDESFADVVAKHEDLTLPATSPADMETISRAIADRTFRPSTVAASLSDAQRRAIREEGSEAYAEGGGESDNPYPFGSAERSVWTEGYMLFMTSDSDGPEDDNIC